MPRPSILAISVTAVAAVAVAGSSASSAHPVKQWSPKKGQALKRPTQIYSHHGVLKVRLVARPTVSKVAGSPLGIQGFNGGLIGPTLHVHPGDTIHMRMVNKTNQMTNIHFHGLHVSPKGISDNVFREMKPGTNNKVVVHIPRDEAPGSYWYHSHMHGLVETQIFGGMSGFIQVEGLGKRLPSGLKGIKKRQLLLKDVQLQKGHPDHIATNENIDPSKHTARLVNGQLKPHLSIRPGETQLWHIGNIGADLYYKLHVPGMKFTVIADDGNPVWRTYRTKTLLMTPGQRYDVLVTGAAKRGTYSLETLHFNQGFQKVNHHVLAHIRVRGPKTEVEGMPTSMGPNESLANAHIAKHRKFRFTMKFEPEFQALINNKVFNPKKINVVAHLGTVEQWTLINHSKEDHPFHIHINAFQVMSINGHPYHARSLQDTVNIPKHGGRVVIRIPFQQFTGEFVFHCHITGHEDFGMMQTVYVVGPGDHHPHPQGPAHPHMPVPAGAMSHMAVGHSPARRHVSKATLASVRGRVHGKWHCHHHARRAAKT